MIIGVGKREVRLTGDKKRKRVFYILLIGLIFSFSSIPSDAEGRHTRGLRVRPIDNYAILLNTA